MMFLRLPQMSAHFFHSRDLDGLREALTDEDRPTVRKKPAFRVVPGKDAPSD